MSKQVSITRRLEFDSGHRIPNHCGQCRNIHGHRYRLDLTLSGEVLHREGASDDGMILDFGDIKALANEHLVNKWDHAFLIYRGDTALLNFLQSMEGHKTVVLDAIPTVENLAQVAFDILAPVFKDCFGHHLQLTRLVLFETPNCWAEVSAPAVLPAKD
ncbi:MULTISPECIES: 6-carboxytetrahydropterin synthase [unclassified Cupriavidus]|uniref:6-pyruvoyl trahydropterin synthase family protein n=1 Tax=unclassified Cupriavidus TaxID=2640874 RepID=UPI001AEA468D|nr:MULTISPECIES: 6-carboxytetrahydropterin synthase [unclassified Cupriavidus]MBP0630280.1 6-carboxytetrahydropterin synthase [Cupriavidus sp. AcVe19-1a]MBP0634075.1 6-carboxytetrahydropterin synthase [Cupriavidus sp. AcVe19-6a]